MKFLFVFSTGRRAALIGISLITPAFGEVVMDYVPVGNAGNPADTTGFGAVSYNYNIAKNEVTIAQYAEFLNAVADSDTYGLYTGNMTVSYINGISQSGVNGAFVYTVEPGSGDKPITFVSWFDAARFTNWMHNGQPVGPQSPATTEDGAYTLNGAITGVTVNKNLDAKVWIPSESEWYKAAYYDPNKGGVGVGGYWAQANQSDALAGNTIGDSGSANYFDGDYVGYPVSALTDVGAYGVNSISAYGTNDQGGNVWEFTDGVIDTARVLRGGAWDSDVESYLSSSVSDDFAPEDEGYNVGFRVASKAIPEPSALLLTLLSASALLAGRRRSN